MDQQRYAWRQLRTRVALAGAVSFLMALSLGGSQPWGTQAASAAGTAATFGKLRPGPYAGSGLLEGYKFVSRAILPLAGSVTKLSVYAMPGYDSPTPQPLKAVIYADSGGVPGALLATGTEVSYSGATNGTGWFELPLASAVTLAPGNYWLGFITGGPSGGVAVKYSSVPNARAYNANSYASGPSGQFGSPTIDSRQSSIYATYTPTPPAEPAGRPKYRLDAASYFNPYVGEVAFLREHVSRILAYPPFGDQFLASGLPVLAYHDYWTEFTQKGNPLGPAGRAEYVAKVKRDSQKGYAGQFMDDANMSGGNIPGSRAELANLTEEVRGAIGPRGLLEWNAQYHDLWPLIKAGDLDVARALAQVNVVTKEFGAGPTSGINTAADYAELFRYIEALHARGVHVVLTGDYLHTDVATMEYNLATYLLANDGGDFINGTNQTPAAWWPGFNVNLGSAVAGRQRSPTGVWTRTFSGGVVYTVEPGAATQTIRLARPLHSVQWGTVESVTLAPGQGAVLAG